LKHANISFARAAEHSNW